MAWLDDIVNEAHARLLQCEPTHPARVYLQERGVLDSDLVRYRLGYFSETTDLRSCSPEFLRWHGRYGYRRLVFPLTNPFGQAIGLQGRHLGDKGYENFVLEPRELHVPVFGLHVALPEMFAGARVVLVEGVFDYFAAVRVAPDTLCTLTANVSLAVKRLLSRYIATAVCLFDMDATGRRGGYRLAGLPVPAEYRKPEDISLKVPPPPPFQVLLPPYSEHDPDDLRKAGKMSELQRLVQVSALARV